MMLSVICALALGQLPLAPVTPVGTNRSLLEASLAVQEHLEKGEFDKATVALQAMPKANLVIRWDVKNVPENLRESLEESREQVFAQWRQFYPTVKPTIVASGKADLVFSFTDKLPDTVEGFPAAAAHVFSTDPSEPRLEVTIALYRGRPAQLSLPSDFHNEIMYSMVAYFGHERTPFPGAGAFRTDQPGASRTQFSAFEMGTLKRTLELVEKLEKFAKDKVRVEAARPKLQVEPISLTLPNAVQAEPVKFTIQVTNPGNAPLSFRFQPDCGCLSSDYSPVLEPGRTAMVTGFVDTVRFVGKLRHKFYVFANDAEIPFREIPVSIDVEPLVRMVRPGASVLQMGDQGATTDVYLVMSEAAKIELGDASIEGLTGEVTEEAWEGELEVIPGEPKRKVKAIRYRIRLDATSLPGRLQATLAIPTDHPVLPLLRHNIFLQKGILAQPESVYMGEIPNARTSATFLVSRPGFPFKVLEVTTNNPFFKAVATPNEDSSEYRVTVEFDGKGDSGIIETIVTVRTDDPKQPRIEVPIRGIIR